MKVIQIVNIAFHLFFLNILCMSDVCAGSFDFFKKHLSASMQNLPRSRIPDKFNPHRANFICIYQDEVSPVPLDESNINYLKALRLDNPDVYYKNRNWGEIYRLYDLAAKQGHWKAMLNLAALITDEDMFPEKDIEVAIAWVEKAMDLGVPDAYDLMGIYHQQGVIKGGNADSAYAFFQKAADMGSPSAMTFLGDKLGGTYDYPAEGFWANIPIATKMLECALAQGYGDAAHQLGIYQRRGYSAEAKSLALKTFHEGVKLGSEKCAASLALEFRGFRLNDGKNMVGFVDEARAARYWAVQKVLERHFGRLQLPNLDKVLPLPPAPLPKWDGNVKTLIDAAKPVVPEATKPTPQSALPEREQIPSGYGVLPLEQSTLMVKGSEQIAPQSGYWIAVIAPSRVTYNGPPMIAHNGRPERYKAGEPFDNANLSGWKPEDFEWHFVGEPFLLPPTEQELLRLRVMGQQARHVSRLVNAPTCNGMQPCPQSGVWQGRIDDKHALALVYNQWFHQAFVQEGQSFPDPAERFLNIQVHEVQWTYLGSPNRLREGTDVMDIAL